MSGWLENTDCRVMQTLITQTSKTQASKMQTSQFKTSLKTYTFDENSSRMVHIFPIVFGYWGTADFAFFFSPLDV